MGILVQILEGLVVGLAIDLTVRTIKALIALLPSFMVVFNWMDAGDLVKRFLEHELSFGNNVGANEKELFLNMFSKHLVSTIEFAIVMAIVCGIVWWAVARLKGPAAPHEVTRYGRLWWGLAVIYTVAVTSFFIGNMMPGYAHVRFDVNLVLSVGLLAFALGVFIFYLPSLAFSPPTVLATVPGGSRLAGWRRRRT